MIGQGGHSLTPFYYQHPEYPHPPPPEEPPEPQPSPSRLSVREYRKKYNYQKVVIVKEPPKSYDSSFSCIHISVEFVVVVSLICATSEIVLGYWTLFLLSRPFSFQPSTSKYITIGVFMLIAQSVRVYLLLLWLKSSKQELTKAYSVTSLCCIISIFVLTPMSCFILYVMALLNGPPRYYQMEVLAAFGIVGVVDIIFSVFVGATVVYCFQKRVRKRRIYLQSRETTPVHTAKKKSRPTLIVNHHYHDSYHQQVIQTQPQPQPQPQEPIITGFPHCHHSMIAFV